jgi:hypothetical protein
MDRIMVYPGAIPLETDILTTERDVMIALGYALQGYLGTGTVVDGFTCVQTTVPSQSVQVTPGQILTLTTVDASAFSSLPADTTHQIIKQGLMLNTATFTCPAPLTVGQSVNYLIEVAQEDIDGSPVVLPFYNPSAPNVAFSGPAGAGTTNNTVRQSAAIVQIKTGVAATSGNQVTPSADPGFVGMFVVTVAFGQTTITSTSISQLASAPFFTKLPAIPPAVQNQLWTYAADTGAVNAMAVSYAPVPTVAVGLCITVKALLANTGPATIVVNGGASKAVVNPDGTPLVLGAYSIGSMLGLEYDGTSFRITSGLNVTPAGKTPKLNFFEMTTDGTQSVVSSTITAVTDFTLTSSQPSDAVFSAGGTITIGPNTAGIWAFDMMYNPSQATIASTETQCYLYKNGVQYLNVTVQGTFCSQAGTVRVVNGDVLTMRVFQNSGNPQTNKFGTNPFTFFNLYQISS